MFLRTSSKPPPAYRLVLLGTWGETSNRDGTTFFARYTWTGYMVLMSLMFVFGIRAYQESTIRPKREQEPRDAAMKAQDAAKQSQLDFDNFRKETNANSDATLAKIADVQTAAATCPNVKAGLDGLAAFVQLASVSGKLKSIEADVTGLKKAVAQTGASPADAGD